MYSLCQMAIRGTNMNLSMTSGAKVVVKIQLREKVGELAAMLSKDC